MDLELLLLCGIGLAALVLAVCLLSLHLSRRKARSSPLSPAPARPMGVTRRPRAETQLEYDRRTNSGMF